MYSNQVPGQKAEISKPVIIEGEKEWEVKRVLNKKKGIREGQIPGVIERLYGRKQYMGRDKKLGKCKGIGRRI